MFDLWQSLSCHRCDPLLDHRPERSRKHVWRYQLNRFLYTPAAPQHFKNSHRQTEFLCYQRNRLNGTETSSRVSVPLSGEDLRQFARMTDKPQHRKPMLILSKTLLDALQREPDEVRHLDHTLRRKSEITPGEPLSEIARRQNDFIRPISECDSNIDLD